jgi:hypothetical protein
MDLSSADRGNSQVDPHLAKLPSFAKVRDRVLRHAVRWLVISASNRIRYRLC